MSNKFPYTPTQGQEKLFRLFDQLLLKEGPDTLLVKGYAGTGKTSIVSTLVNILPVFNFRSMLLAPTGRAAKVLANYSGRKAFTIHKIIYKLQQDKESGELRFVRQKNYHKSTIFIIDEASMIYDHGFGGKSLLMDLKEYVFEHSSNKMIIIGDTAQLPPVGFDYSGALDKQNLTGRYQLNVMDIELDEVVRQARSSGILANATLIRQNIQNNKFNISLSTAQWKDISRMTGDKMEDGLRYTYDKFGIENVIVICRSNKQTIQYNQYIRRQILFYDNFIDAADYIMIVKNNYHWLDDGSPAGFLANGDFAEVLKIANQEELYGFSFADLDLRLVDYPDHPIIRAKALLNTLYSPSPALFPEDQKKLYENVREDYQNLPKKDQLVKLAGDPYLNALQVKFTYAITCHKSQGGQWPAVFLDQGYLKEDMKDISYLRWLYTGMTRATEELYMVNFNAEFFR